MPRISELTAASVLDGTELVPVVKGGATQRATVAAVRAGLLSTRSVTGSYTLVAADAGMVLEVSSAFAVTITLPANVLPAGSVVEVVRMGAGAVTLAAGSGATVVAMDGLGIEGQYGAVRVRARTATAFHVSGDLVAAAASFLTELQKIPGLTHYYPLTSEHQAQDLVGGLHGTIVGGVTFSSTQASFDGTTGYIEVADHDDFSLRAQTSQGLTVLAFQSVSNWIPPDQEGDGYVHWMGKGVPTDQQEYAFRYYAGDHGTRPKRTSVYHYTPSDVLNNNHQGAGSYFQDDDAAGFEKFITGAFDLTTTSGVSGAGTNYPGAVFLYKDGVLRDSDGFENGGTYNINPGNTTAPFRIGTRNMASFHVGSIRRVAVYNRKLTAAEVQAIQDARTLPG